MASTSPPHVLVTSRSFATASPEAYDRLTGAGLTVARGSTTHELSELRQPLATALAWVAGVGTVTRAHFQTAPRLRVLARYGVGVDSVDLAAAAEHGVLVTHTPEANTTAVAEHTLALVLAALRHLPAADHALRRGSAPALRGRELARSTVGLLGFGAIGRAVATRMIALGARVFAHDPHVADTDISGAGCVPTAGPRELAAHVDVFSLHSPGETTVVDRPLLRALPRGAVVVNTARAQLLAEAEVAQALRDGKLAAVATDVATADSPLLRAPNVIATPHIAGLTSQSVDRMSAMVTTEILRALDGQPPLHPVFPTGMTSPHPREV